MKYIAILSLVFLSGCANLNSFLKDPDYVSAPSDHQPRYSSPQAAAAFNAAVQNFVTQQHYNNQAYQQQMARDAAEQRSLAAENAARTQAAIRDAMAPITGVGSVNVNGYRRSNGTYVAPHTRTRPDGNPFTYVGE